ncbi:MAG: class I SAM-dependent methyltransferase, partial [Flavobacteriales bacterium]
MKEYENAAKIFNTHAKLYEQKYMDVSRYVFGIQRFLVGMKMNAHVLELGCGPGNLTKMIHEFRPDLHITGIDLAPDMI